MSSPQYNPMDLLAAIKELALANLSGDEDRIQAARDNYNRVKAS